MLPLGYRYNSYTVALESGSVFISINLASFPGSREWAKKEDGGTHCLHLLSSPRISGNLEISIKSVVTLPSV